MVRERTGKTEKSSSLLGDITVEIEIAIIQGMVDGKNNTAIGDGIGRPWGFVKKIKASIADVYSADQGISGLALAVRDRVSRGDVDLSNLPDVSNVEITGDEARVLSRVLRGLKPKRIADEMGIYMRDVCNLESDLMRKMGVRGNEYTLVALGTKILMDAQEVTSGGNQV